MNAKIPSQWGWKAGCIALGAAILLGVGRPGDANAIPGRFQIALNPAASSDTYLLDTTTGDAWRVSSLNRNGGAGPVLVWAKVDRVNQPAETSAPQP